MHGRGQNCRESCRSLQRISSQHMRSVLPLATSRKTVSVTGDRHRSLPSPVSTATATDSFSKDGRRISIGDCALFKPPQDCPPFIGLIRSLRLSKENNLQLGVNWLYRPSGLELGKGTTPVDSAPNEIFYSFHKDETPAASLLHPCKVAFLPRGAELPKGTSSYVCRRVYDVENKCLWWLTDQKFINVSDHCEQTVSLLNYSLDFPCFPPWMGVGFAGRGYGEKERQEEVNQLLYKTRTEMHATLQPDGRSPKQVNNSPKSTSQMKPASDSGQSSGTLPSQVKGKKRERVDHGSDYVKRGRSSRTDGGENLHHKSESNLKSEIARITENGGLVDLEGVDKLVQLMQPDRMERKTELVSRSLLAGVMAATDKVDCLNRFVQHRGLPILDGWLQDIHKGKVGDSNNDKFVEELLLVLLRALDKLPVNLHALQMCNIGRSVNHLRSHKNLEIQRKARSLVDTWKKRVEAEMISIDAKSRQPETSHGGSDVAVKSSISENSVIKTTSVNGENNNMKSAASSPGAGKPALSGKESQQHRISIGDVPSLIREDRSSSSNSQSHNQSQSSSGKGDGRKSRAAGSVAVSKISSNNSNRRSISNTASQKETTSSVIISSAHKNTSLDKFSQSSFSSRERTITDAISHKLIVKIPNPAQGVGGGSLEDPTAMSSRASSPPLTDKQFDHTSLDKGDGYRNVASDVNVGSYQNCESKNVLTGSAGEEHRTTTEDPRRSIEASPSNQWNTGKLHASSFSPMNALVESCAKYSEAANSSMSLEDDVGMNLLASVAAGEISISNMMISPSDSTERSTPAVEEVCNGNEAKSKSTPEDNMVGVQSEFHNDENKQAAVDGCSNKYFRTETDTAMKTSDNKSNGKSTPLMLPISGEKIRDGESNDVCSVSRDSILNCKHDGFCVTVPEEKTSIDLLSDKDKSSVLKEESNMGTSSPQKMTSVVVKDEVAERANYEKLHPTDEKDFKGCTNKFDGVNTDTKLNRSDSQCKEDCSSTSDAVKNYHKEESVKDEEIFEDISVPRKGPPGFVCIEADEKAELRGPGSTSSRPDEGSSSSNVDSKVKFDLNEGFSVDEDKYGDAVNLLPSVPTTVHLINSSPFPATSIPSSNHSASITVSAPAKGPFVPPEDLLRSKAEIGWKGSAATSAFRPAEPRKLSDSPNTPPPDASASKHGRVPLDIDLNVPDETVIEEIAYRDSTNDTVTNRATSLNGAPSSVSVRSSGWLDFDLNTVDEASDVGQCSTSSNYKGEGSVLHAKPLSHMPTVDVRRDFDLNNGPGVDDNSTEQFQIIQQMKEGIPLPPHLSSATSLRVNGPGMGNLSSWFLPGSTYSTVAIPSVFPADRGEQQRFPVFPSSGPQRPYGPPSGVNPFIPDIYRGSVLSSSPMPLQSSPFQFPVFQFGDSFPVGATSSHRDTVTAPRFFAPPLNAQFQGPVASQFQRPFMVNLPDNTGNDGLVNGRMWGRQELDLNSGPGTMESEVREQMLPHSLGQHSLAASQALAEEHARMYSVSGATLKRNDHPEGSRENESFRRKQSPWQ